MGLSSNQARFLSLTSRQVDMEQRIQQICQRRLRLSSELENVATSYNNTISNRKMFTPSLSSLNSLSIDTLKQLGYRVINSATKTLANTPLKPINQLSEADAIAAGYTTIHNAQELQSLLNANPSGKFMLQGDIDLSSLGTLSTSLVNTTFNGQFDGNGYNISNLKIDTGTYAGSSVGFFSTLDSATVKNLALDNVSINAFYASGVGAIAGSATNTNISNSYVAGSGIVANMQAGGLVGSSGTLTLSDSYAEIDVTGNYAVGGALGATGGSNISTIYSTGNVLNTNNTTIGGTYHGCDTGGLIGNNFNSVLTNSYTTGNVTGATSNTGGLVGYNKMGTITKSYAAEGTVNGGGLVGNNGSPAGTDDASNFYANNAGGDAGGATTNISAATSTWSSSIWDLSGKLPQLINSGNVNSNSLEKGLRNGTYSLAREADEFSQETINIEDKKYEEVDWRTTPEIYDELYKGDDVAAEDKYDKTVSEINAQDKKLQLEQTSIETEYKAITSEKEAVKKILDTNAQNSFKYFS